MSGDEIDRELARLSETKLKHADSTSHPATRNDGRKRKKRMVSNRTAMVVIGAAWVLTGLLLLLVGEGWIGVAFLLAGGVLLLAGLIGKALRDD